jgi:hypothetical protein
MSFDPLLIIPALTRVKQYIHEKRHEHWQRGGTGNNDGSANAAIFLSRRINHARIRYGKQRGAIKLSRLFSHVK